MESDCREIGINNPSDGLGLDTASKQEEHMVCCKNSPERLVRRFLSSTSSMWLYLNHSFAGYDIGSPGGEIFQGQLLGHIIIVEVQ